MDTTISVGLRPRGIGAHPNGNYVYVANKDDNNISVISTSDNNVVTTIAVGSATIFKSAIGRVDFLIVLTMMKFHQ